MIVFPLLRTRTIDHVPPQDLKLQTELVESFLFFVMKDIVVWLSILSFYTSD